MTTLDQVDSKDLKILEILSKDSRTNLYKIAKICEISSTAVLTRIRKLKKKKVIVGSKLVLANGALGYPCRATIGVTADINKIHEVFDEIRCHPNVTLSNKSIGRYNIVAYVISTDLNELEKITQRIKSIPGIKGIAINIITETSYVKGFDIKHKEPAISKVNNVDLAIIKELMIDSQLAFSEIATRVGVTPGTVRKKFEKLKTKGIIISCSIIIDYSKLGYEGLAFIFVRQAQGTEKIMIIEELRKIQSILLIDSLVGAFDIVIHALLNDLNSLVEIVEEIQSIHSVGQIDVCLVPITYYWSYPIPRSPIKINRVELT